MASIARLHAALRGRYSIVGVAGRGGSATVFRARDLKFGRTVALKVLHADDTTNPGADRFLAEVRITARLQHPNILPLLDSGRAGPHLYLVTPFVEGSSLRERLHHEGALAVSEAVRLTVTLAEALAYAHRQGVVHLDIKPANILLSNGHPVIADFGIARAASESQTALARDGIAAGTPEYMSPEQVRGEKVLDGRSDVYSLSCLLYEMLAGRPPFAATSAAAVMSRHLNDRPPSVSGAVWGVSPSVDHLLRRGLAKDVAGRFPSADAMLRELESLSTVSGTTGAVSATMALMFLAGLAGAALSPAGSSRSSGTPPSPEPPGLHLPAEVGTGMPAGAASKGC